MSDQNLYEKLVETATGHLNSCQPKTKGSNDVDKDLIHSYLDPSFQIDWGHSFWVSGKVGLQGKKTGEEFVSHLAGTAQILQTWNIEITDTSIDTHKRRAVVRADFHMVPKGGEEVLNDIIFWLTMDDAGEKVTRCTEFTDTVASDELGSRIKRAW